MPSHVLVDTDTIQTVSNKDLADCTLTDPILSGTATGAYTLGGTPAISNPTITTPTVTGALTIAGQIVFPAVQNPSAGVNTLDDYEEGTWTPSLGGTTTYTSQLGSYVKIGRVVYIKGVLFINVLGTGSTSTFSGLPFTVAAQQEAPIRISTFSTLATAVVALYGRVNNGTLTGDFFGAAAAATSNGGVTNIFGNSTLIYFSAFYFVD